MLRRKSTHKRKRSSSRADQAKKSDSSRIMANNIWNDPSQNPKGKGKEKSSEDRFLDCINMPLLHSLDLLIPSSSNSTPTFSLIQSLGIQARDPRFEKVRGRTYLIRNAPLSLFLDPGFLVNHIKSGTLTMISSGSLDSQDVICLDGKGNLILSVTKETYQTLGLTGRPSRFSRTSSGWAGDRRSGKHQRFIIEIDLLSETFTPKHKGYKKVISILNNWDSMRNGAQKNRDQELTRMFSEETSKDPITSSSNHNFTSISDQTQKGSWNLLITWIPPFEISSPNHQDLQTSTHESSSSTAPQIHFPNLIRADQIKEIKMEVESSVVDEVWVPEIGSRGKTQERIEDPDSLDDLIFGWKEQANKEKLGERKEVEETGRAALDFESWKEKVLSLEEWVGMNSSEEGSEKFKLYNNFPTNTSSYSPNFPMTQGSLSRILFKGLLSPQLVKFVNEKVEDWIEEENKSRRELQEIEQIKKHNKEKKGKGKELTNGEEHGDGMDRRSSLAWAVMTGKCFKDASISWNLREGKKLDGNKIGEIGLEEFQDQEIVREDGDEGDEESESVEGVRRKRVRFNQDGPEVQEIEGEEDDHDEDDLSFGSQDESSGEDDSESEDEEEEETPALKDSTSNSANSKLQSNKPFSKSKRRKQIKKRGYVKSGERERSSRFGREDSSGFMVLAFGKGMEEKEEHERDDSLKGKKRRRNGETVPLELREYGEGRLEQRKSRWIVLESVGLDLRN